MTTHPQGQPHEPSLQESFGEASRELRKRRFSADRIEMAEQALSDEPGFVALDPWQRDFLSCDDRRIILNCSRQIGKSTTASIYALHTAMFVPRSLVLIFAPSMRQSQEFFKKLTPVYRDLGKLIPPTSEQRLTLELENRSRIVTLPGTEKTTRGFAAPALVIIDEAAAIEDILFTQSIQPMLLRSGGQIMMLSTPAGKQGVFYKIWTGEMGGDKWTRFRVPVTDVPSVPQAAIDDARAASLPHEFAQEYMCEFIDTEETVFPPELVREAKGRWYGPLFPSPQFAHQN